MALLEIENLQAHFRTPEGVNRAVDGVSFTVESGETLAIAAITSVILEHAHDHLGFNVAGVEQGGERRAYHHACKPRAPAR